MGVDERGGDHPGADRCGIFTFGVAAMDGNENRPGSGLSRCGTHAADSGAGVHGADDLYLLLVDCEVQQLSRVLVRLEGNGKTLPISGGGRMESVRGVEELIEAADRGLYYNKEIVKRRQPAVVAKV